VWEAEEAEIDPQVELVSLRRPSAGGAEEAEIDRQVELVSRHCLPGGLENIGNIRRREQQRESCHGEQIIEVWGKRKRLRSLTGNVSWYRGVVFPPGAWRTRGMSIAESSARADTIKKEI
jgi:hypothetical protein